MLVMWIPCFHCVVVSGQAEPVLSVPRLFLSQITDTYAAYFADGQNTSDAFFGLPHCDVFGGYSDYLELYNVNTSLPVGHRGSFDNGRKGRTSLEWNDTAYPMLDPSFTGLYGCRTNGSTSKETYQLNVRSKMSTVTPHCYTVCLICKYWLKVVLNVVYWCVTIFISSTSVIWKMLLVVWYTSSANKYLVHLEFLLEGIMSCHDHLKNQKILFSGTCLCAKNEKNSRIVFRRSPNRYTDQS